MSTPEIRDHKLAELKKLEHIIQMSSANDLPALKPKIDVVGPS